MSFLAPGSEDAPMILSRRDRWLPSMRQLRLVAMWCTIYLLLNLLGHLDGSAWLLLPWLAVWIAALILLIAGLFYLRSIRRAPGAVLLTISLLPIAVTVVAPLIDRVAARSAFELRRSDYQSAVDMVNGSRAAMNGGTTARGTTFLVDAGPPRRVAFVTNPGVVDNWAGVIYDPTDAVASAQAPSWTEAGAAVSPEVRELFGGDIVSCRHIDDHFYRCGFT